MKVWILGMEKHAFSTLVYLELADGDLISGIACAGRCWKYRSGCGKYGKYLNITVVRNYEYIFVKGKQKNVFLIFSLPSGASMNSRVL